MTRLINKWYWLVRKDLACELRARQVWPVMLLLGTVVVLSFAIELNVAAAERQRLAGGFLWLSVFFAGSIALDRTMARECEESALRGLLAFPIPAGLVYVAKLTVNFLALIGLECALIPLFAVLTGTPFGAHPWRLLLAAMLANVGIAAVGTLLSAVTAGTPRGSGLLAVLVLPLAIPVLVGAAEATRLGMADAVGTDWFRWIQLLAAFAIVFVTAGMMLFDFMVEE